MKNETIKTALANITHYKDFAEYAKFENDNREDFQSKIDDGFIQDISIGVYNGATDTFLRSELNDENIIMAIREEVNEENFQILISDYEIATSITTSSEAIEYYTQIFKVFTLGGKLFVNID